MVRALLVSVLSVVLLANSTFAQDGLTSKLNGGASMRRRQDKGNPYGPVAHGSYGLFDNQEYRWHQIYDGTWVGIDPSEWDDNVHISNDELAPWKSAKELTVNNSTLQERGLVDGICKAGNACLVAGSSLYNVGTAGIKFFSDLAQTQHAKGAVEFFSKPVVQRVTIATGGVLNGAVSGAISGLVAAKVAPAPAPNGPPTLATGVSETTVCSTEKSALDAIVLLLQQQSKQYEQMNSQFSSLASELLALKISIGSAIHTQEFLSVTVATVECGKTPEPGFSPNCGVQIGTCV